MWEDGLPNGEIGCQQPGLPFNMLLLQTLQRQTQVTIYSLLFSCVFAWLLWLVSNCFRSPLSAALAPSQLFKANFTANPTLSSCSRAKATMTRASDANSTKSSGPPRRQIIQQTRHNRVCLCPITALPLPFPPPNTSNTSRWTHASYAGALLNHPRAHLLLKFHQNRYMHKQLEMTGQS